ncbi:hypothetical protein CPJCM30710_24990 [Clostridium polyendosporum]|uniref:Uncharacterized protein n=1 Tax=Clostridium polyendosporum TaxID=69208 RepID=A0A919S227_9CLOT|nr:hypothetical protein [Clostridium polyendosporum]GIM29833.1 hypothetical protein CPJCM30710_24990 [Clostridium polyendosporum]
MPIDSNILNLYLQLGIAGATLAILLVFVILLFKFISENKRNKTNSDTSRIDKLCDKIDALISSNAEHTQKLNEVLLANDKDQKTTIGLLDKILAVALDTQRRVLRIDDRTFTCLGNSRIKDKEEE